MPFSWSCSFIYYSFNRWEVKRDIHMKTCQHQGLYLTNYLTLEKEQFGVIKIVGKYSLHAPACLLCLITLTDSNIAIIAAWIHPVFRFIYWCLRIQYSNRKRLDVGFRDSYNSIIVQGGFNSININYLKILFHLKLKNIKLKSFCFSNNKIIFVITENHYFKPINC